MSRLRVQLLQHAWLQLGLWVAIAVIANHAASAAFWRFDLTNDREYTLQPASREVMARVDMPLVARMYFTEGLEAPYTDFPREVRDKLEELAAFTGGRMVVETVDPKTEAEVEEAQQFGLDPVTYRFRARARAEYKQVFMGVVFVYGERQEVVDHITTLETLEYDLVRAVHSLTTKAEDRKVVGVLQGDGEPDLWQYPPENPLGKLRESLGAVYEVRPVTLGGDEGVPEDVDALLVIGPQQPVPDRTVYQLDQFVMRGGSLALFLGNVRPDFETMHIAGIHHGLDPWLEHLGVRWRRDLVLDRKNNDVMQVPVAAGRRRVLVPLNYPLIPVTTGLDHDSPITRGLDRAVAPFVSTFDLAEPLPADVEAWPLVRTLETSGAVEGLRTLRPDALGQALPSERTGPFLIAAALGGPFHSFFADRPIPGIEGGPREDPASTIVDGSPARIVVVGSADFVANNLTFVMNAMDWLVADPALIAIRSRVIDVDRLDVADDVVWRWKALIVGAPALILLLAGTAVGLRARRAA